MLTSEYVRAGFSDWAEVMDGWGSRMLAALQSVAKLAAEGLGLVPTAFSERMAFGPHLVPPTGVRLRCCTKSNCECQTSRKHLTHPRVLCIYCELGATSSNFKLQM